MYEELKLQITNEKTTTINNYTKNIEDDETIAAAAAVVANEQQIKCITHNSVLNCLLILTKSNKLYVYDCNTRSYLTKISWNCLTQGAQTLENNNNNRVSLSLTVENEMYDDDDNYDHHSEYDAGLTSNDDDLNINLSNNDNTSSNKLASSLHITSKSNVNIVNIQEKCLIISDKTICSRTAYDGTLLLDSVFQTPINSKHYSIEQFKFEIEINLNDAYTLVNVLKSIENETINGLDEIVFQLNKQLLREPKMFKNDSVSVRLGYGGG